MARSRRARRKSGKGKARQGSRAGVWTGRVTIAIIALVGIALIGGYLWMQSYLRSDRFREMVNRRVGDFLQVEATFDKFLWDGMELRAPSFKAEGENMIRRIELENLETEVRFAPLLSKRLEIWEVHARRVHVEIDVTKDSPQSEDRRKEAFKFTTARLDEMSGEVDFGTSALRWDGIQGNISPGYAPGSYDATLSRGTLLTPLTLFSELDLQDASLRYVDRALFLKSGDWHVFKSGRLATDGEIDFGTGRYVFNGDLVNVQCDEVVPDDWSKRLRGELRSNFTVEGAGKEAPLIIGELELVRGHLTALPLLDRIAAFTATERFRRLDFRIARLKYRQEGDKLELTEIVIATEGLLRLEGDLTIEGGRLEGLIQLGVTPATLGRIPGAADRVFVAGKNGMHWTPVKITGTTKFPREDLSERLIAAGFEWMYEMVDGQLVFRESGKVAGDFARGLWETGGEGAKVGIDLIGQGVDLLKGVPNPVGPIRNGVGSLIEGILGNPRRPQDREMPPQPKRPEEERKDQEREPLGEEKGVEEETEKDAGKEGKEKGNDSVDQEEGKSILERAQKALEKELGFENP